MVIFEKLWTFDFDLYIGQDWKKLSPLFKAHLNMDFVNPHSVLNCSYVFKNCDINIGLYYKNKTNIIATLPVVGGIYNSDQKIADILIDYIDDKKGTYCQIKLKNGDIILINGPCAQKESDIYINFLHGYIEHRILRIPSFPSYEGIAGFLKRIFRGYCKWAFFENYKKFQSIELEGQIGITSALIIYNYFVETQFLEPGDDAV